MITKETKKAGKIAEVAFLSKIMNSENLKSVKLLDFYDMWVETFKKDKVSARRLQKIAITMKNLESFFGESQTLRSVTKIKDQQ